MNLPALNFKSQTGGLLRAVVAVLLFARIASAETILLKDAIVHTVSGQVISPGDVLIDNGKITQVGQIDAAAAKPDHVVDLAGQHLYPGLIALNTGLGLVEIAAVRATVDEAEPGEFDPDVESWIAVNPDSELIPVTRANGVTIAEPTPRGGMIAGQSGLVALDGWTSEQMVFKKPVALHVYWPDMDINPSPRRGGGGGGARGAGRGGPRTVDDQARERKARLKELDDYFVDAAAYAQAREAAQTNGAADPGLNPSWEAMRPYVRGQLPIMVHADDARQIKAALKWAETNHYKIIIAGGRDGWMVADLIAKQNVPVVFDQVFAMPARDFEPYDVHYKAAEVMRRAGVKVIFSLGAAGTEPPEDPGLVKNLPYEAAKAVAFGFPADEAIKAMTLYPAQIMGVADRVGSIEQGKDATLFACDGDILDIRANVRHVWIAGKEVSLESRHTRLYDKYRNRPKQ